MNIIKKLNEYALKNWGTEVGIHNGIIKSEYSEQLKWWIERQYHASMTYLSDESRQNFRNNPKLLFPELLSMIVVRIPYQIESTSLLKNNLTSSPYYVAQYAQGRDYHKVVKKELEQMAQWLQQLLIENGYHDDWVYRTFTDSAPIMEVAIAADSNMGWRGKNTLLIHPKQGSFYFIGELFTSLSLKTAATKTENHCGTCTACIKKCPTNAITKYKNENNQTYYTVDANKCISYWTIEHQGNIPLELREKIGNRLYGCDDCQIYCPWNGDKFIEKQLQSADKTKIKPVLLHFQKKNFWTENNSNGINYSINQLIHFLSWNEVQFLKNMEGTAVRRIGYVSWIRNVLIVMGNFIRQNTNDETVIIDALDAIQQKMTQLEQISDEHWLLELGRWAMYRKRYKEIG